MAQFDSYSRILALSRNTRHGLVAQIPVEGKNLAESFLAIIQQLDSTGPA